MKLKYYSSHTVKIESCAGIYRFGFNGQEKDNEIAGRGNSMTAQFWKYDTRLGRRSNLDPFDQIGISNYAVNGLNPIYYNDPLGDKKKSYKHSLSAFISSLFTGGGGKIHTDKHGNYVADDKEKKGKKKGRKSKYTVTASDCGSCGSENFSAESAEDAKKAFKKEKKKVYAEYSTYMSMVNSYRKLNGGNQYYDFSESDDISIPSSQARKNFLNNHLMLGFLGSFGAPQATALAVVRIPPKGYLGKLSKYISKQKQARHLKGTAPAGKGYLNSIDDAQHILDAVRKGEAQFQGMTKTGHAVFKYNNVTGTNVNLGGGVLGQPTNTFMIKGTVNPTVVPMRPGFIP